MGPLKNSTNRFLKLPKIRRKIIQAERLLSTPSEMAEQLKVSVNTIYYWVARHEIPFMRIGKHLRFSPNEVLGFFAKKVEESSSCFHGELFVYKDKSRSLTTKNGRPAPLNEE